MSVFGTYDKNALLDRLLAHRTLNGKVYPAKAATVWLQVALKAEQQGCQVVGFWMDEPIIECPVSIDASEVKYYLENEAYGGCSRDRLYRRSPLPTERKTRCLRKSELRRLSKS